MNISPRIWVMGVAALLISTASWAEEISSDASELSRDKEVNDIVDSSRGGGGGRVGGGGHGGGGRVGGGGVHGGGGRVGGGGVHGGGGRVGGGGVHGGGGRVGGGGVHGGGGRVGGGGVHGGGGRVGGGGVHGGGGRVGGGGVRGGGGGHHGVNPGGKITKTDPAHRVPHNNRPSHLENSHSAGNLNSAKNRINSIAHSEGVKTHINGRADHFGRTYGSRLSGRYGRFGGYYHNDHFRYYYSSWFRYGFCGGFYFPVRPWWGIHLYFYYPLVYWLYVDIGVADIPFYQSIYYPDYDSCPVKPFEFSRMFFPTDSIRDLAIDMGALHPSVQCNFRIALLKMTRSLSDQISSLIQASFRYEEFSIVVNHYENLQNRGVSLEGFVDQGNLHVPFKAYLDLVKPAEDTFVFLPTSQEPTSADLNKLDEVNSHIRSAGGDPNKVYLEPEK